MLLFHLYFSSWSIFLFIYSFIFYFLFSFPFFLHSILFVCVHVSDESCFYVCVYECVRADPIHTQKNRTLQSITQYLYICSTTPIAFSRFEHAHICCCQCFVAWCVLFWFLSFLLHFFCSISLQKLESDNSKKEENKTLNPMEWSAHETCIHEEAE